MLSVFAIRSFIAQSLPSDEAIFQNSEFVSKYCRTMDDLGCVGKPDPQGSSLASFTQNSRDDQKPSPGWLSAPSNDGEITSYRYKSGSVYLLD